MRCEGRGLGWPFFRRAVSAADFEALLYLRRFLRLVNEFTRASLHAICGYVGV